MLTSCANDLLKPVAQQDRIEQFHKTLRTLDGGADQVFFNRTELEIREQIAFENAMRSNALFGHALIELFSKKYIRRTVTAIIVLQVGILSGSLAIQNYQPLLCNALRFNG
jgi:hypothetical protein